MRMRPDAEGNFCNVVRSEDLALHQRGDIREENIESWRFTLFEVVRKDERIGAMARVHVPEKLRVIESVIQVSEHPSHPRNLRPSICTGEVAGNPRVFGCRG